MARTKAEALRVGDRRGGSHDAVDVEQRLAHAHEDDVGQALADAGQPTGARNAPGRRSPRSPGRARSRAHRWRRTDSRRRSRPGSRCTRSPARVASRAPDSASGPTRSSRPSSRRCECLLRQPVVRGRDLGVGEGRHAECVGQLRAEPIRERAQLVARLDRGRPDVIADLSGPVRGLAAISRDDVESSSAGTPDSPGRASRMPAAGRLIESETRCSGTGIRTHRGIVASTPAIGWTSRHPSRVSATPASLAHGSAAGAARTAPWSWTQTRRPGRCPRRPRRSSAPRWRWRPGPSRTTG